MRRGVLNNGYWVKVIIYRMLAHPYIRLVWCKYEIVRVIFVAAKKTKKTKKKTTKKQTNKQQKEKRKTEEKKREKLTDYTNAKSQAAPRVCRVYAIGSRKRKAQKLVEIKTYAKNKKMQFFSQVKTQEIKN